MSKPTTSKAIRATTLMPVVTMEEVPVLSDEERAELLQSLKDAQADIAAGRFTELKVGEVEDWLREIAREERQKKSDGL
jgi:hypothetical protein